MEFKLGENEKRILQAAELRAHLSVRELAESLGVKDHLVRYTLQKLTSNGIISSPRPYVNMYRLGFVEYVIQFSLGGPGWQQHDKFIARLVESKYVAWICETDEDYQYVLLSCVKHVSGVFALLDEMSRVAPHIIIHKTLCIRKSFVLFGRKYLVPEEDKGRWFEYNSTDDRVDASKVDLPLLNTMTNSQIHTLRDLSQSCGLPIATVERHKKALEQHRVIEGYIYRIDTFKLGMHSYRLLLSTMGTGPTVREKVFSFAQRSPWVFYFDECVGPWDYALGIEVYRSRDIKKIKDELYAELGSHISAINSHLLFSYLKSSKYFLE